MRQLNLLGASKFGTLARVFASRCPRQQRKQRYSSWRLDVLKAMQHARFEVSGLFLCVVIEYISGWRFKMHLEFHLLHWNEQQQSLPDCWQDILTYV